MEEGSETYNRPNIIKMINILVIDDNQQKLKNIRKVIEGLPEKLEFDTATNINSAKRLLSSNYYDLLILDLSLPVRDGDDPMPENGVNFLQDINKESRLIKPYHIIGLSEYDEYISQFKAKFDDDLWSLIQYDGTSVKWELLIKRKIDYLINSKRSFSESLNRTYDFDLAIITALRDTELDAILALDANWQAFKFPNDATEYFKGIFEKGSKKIRAIAASAPQMGMVAASVLTNKLIVNFRPRHLVMAGIAGGVRGIGNFGDLLIADISFDSGSGKIKTNEDGTSKFEPDYKSIELDVDLKESLLGCRTSREFLDDIRRGWMADKPSTELKIHIGPLASGAGVVENEKIIEGIKGHSRKLIGIDMETYGVFYTAKNCSKPRPLSAFSIKGLSDFCDQTKCDDYQKYAAYTSANFIYNFAVNKMDFEDVLESDPKV